MNNLLLGLVIIIVLGFATGYITYSDCRDCAEDYPLKDYSVIQFYTSLTGFPVASFSFSWETNKEVIKCVDVQS